MADQLIDTYNRVVDYVRISVTDRCDFRCVYCMHEEMTFLPRNEILTLEEIALVAEAFVQLGVSKIRLTGGEPLVRKNIEQLVSTISHLPGLQEVNLSTNGSQLCKMATELKSAGLNRINISLDSLDPQQFLSLTRTGDLQQVLDGIVAAKKAGFKRIKINAVILKGRNDHEILNLIHYIREHHLDISFIEEMPLGVIEEHDRAVTFMSSTDVKTIIETRFQLVSDSSQTPGPSRYWHFADGHESRIGFISPHSHNFCDSCNRVRLTAQGRLLLCLGNEHSVDLRAILRDNPNNIEPVKDAIKKAMNLKPQHHHFDLAEEVSILRFMNTTGG